MEKSKQLQISENSQAKQWYPVWQFAEKVGISSHALRQWLNKHSEFTEKYCQNVSTGPKIKSWLIHENGVAPYIAMKDKGNRTSIEKRSSLNVAKQRVGEKANEALAAADLLALNLKDYKKKYPNGNFINLIPLWEMGLYPAGVLNGKFIVYVPKK